MGIVGTSSWKGRYGMLTLMNELHARRHMAENESVFRQYNERIQKGFDELAALAQEEGRNDLVFSDDSELQFYCECSDENCKQRIPLRPSEYAQIHEHRKRFVLIKGHETNEIERVIGQTSGYAVVEKEAAVPEIVPSLHDTTIENASV